MKSYNDRRKFIKTTAAAVAGFGITGTSFAKSLSLLENEAGKRNRAAGTRVGIIGLDTSHSTAFTKSLNNPSAGPEFGGYKVVAAYPNGSKDIESSVKRIPGYTNDVKKLGVEITASIEELLNKVDVVLLETNDGRPHLEQAMMVLKAGKPMFIDKPVAASLADVISIYNAAKQYKVPVFSASSLRYMESAQTATNGKIGKVLGADTYSPATLEQNHPDLYWYGIHGVETLFTVMGTGCKTVSRVHTDSTDMMVGVWSDGRIGTVRGTRSGQHNYGGTVYGEKGDATLGPYNGYDSLLVQIIKFFQTGQPPVSPEETLEIYAFMSAADESKRNAGAPVSLEDILRKAGKKN